MNTIAPRLGHLRMRQLQLFVWLSEGCTLRSAAQRLHVSPAAVTLMLHELEASVGVTLFERDRRGARPTPAGVALAQHAQLVLADFAALEARCANLGRSAAVLRLGVIPQVMMERVPNIAARYCQRHSGSLQVSEGTSPTLLARVSRGQLSAAIVRLGAVGAPLLASEGQGLQVQRLGGERAAIAVPAGHPLAAKRRVHPKDLATLRWVLPQSGSYIRDMLHMYFQLHQLGQPQAALQVDTTVQALWCAARVGCAAAGPLALIERFAKDWKLKALHLQWAEPVELGLVYRSAQMALPEFAYLHECVLAT